MVFQALFQSSNWVYLSHSIDRADAGKGMLQHKKINRGTTPTTNKRADCPNQTLEYDRDWASSDHSRCGPSYSTHIGWLQVKCPDPGYWFTENPITELLLKEILIVNTQLADKWKLENDWLYKFRLARCAACRFIWVGSPLYFPREMVYRYITLIWHQQRQNKQKM